AGPVPNTNRPRRISGKTLLPGAVAKPHQREPDAGHHEEEEDERGERMVNHRHRRAEPDPGRRRSVPGTLERRGARDRSAGAVVRDRTLAREDASDRVPSVEADEHAPRPVIR